MHLVVGLFWEASFQRNYLILVQKYSNREPQLEPKLAWCAGRTPHFHPWVNMVAQVVPNGAQSGSKGVQRVPK